MDKHSVPPCRTRFDSSHLKTVGIIRTHGILNLSYDPTFVKGGHKERAVYHVYKRAGLYLTLMQAPHCGYKSYPCLVGIGLNKD